MHGYTMLPNGMHSRFREPADMCVSRAKSSKRKRKKSTLEHTLNYLTTCPFPITLYGVRSFGTLCLCILLTS